MRLLCVTLCIFGLSACGSATPAENTERQVAAAHHGNDGQEVVGTTMTEESVNEEQHQATIPNSPLRFRLELEHPTMRADGRPNVDVDARLDGRLWVRNNGEEEAEVTLVLPGSFELEWDIRGEDGSRWTPTFLSPGLPPPDGLPSTTVTIAAGEEVEFVYLHGISGYRRVGEESAGFVPMLPVGEYEVIVSAIRFGELGSFTAAPAQLSVQSQ